jgi:BirA family biotin operon repressor/biotin-[acetyl-CoA-carboxylase] ligase
VLADVQTAGRGRRGREWFSPQDAGVYLSMVVRPPEAARAVSLVTLGAGVAVAAAVRRTSGLPVQLKWPNDVVVGRPWRKLGGVLTEAASGGDRVDAIVVGVGINLRQVRYPKEIGDRATSIETELGRMVDKGPLIVELLRQMRDVLGALHGGEAERVRQEWRRLGSAGLSGAAVCWREGEQVRRGRARDIDIDGALIVEGDRGLERIVAGEVLWETRGGE